MVQPSLRPSGLVCTLVLASCLTLPGTGRAQSPLLPSGVAPVTPRCTVVRGAAPRVTADEDRSITAAEAAALGLPSLDHRWSKNELAGAVTRLLQLGAGDPARLPRVASRRSGTLFARVLDAVPPPPLAGGRPPQQVLQDATAWMDAAEPSVLLLKLYSGLVDRGAPFQQEALELGVLQLSGMAPMLEAMPGFLATIPADDPTREIRLGGMRQTQLGALQLAVGLVQELELSREALPPADRAALVRRVAALVLRVWPQLPPEHRGALLVEVERALAAEPAGTPVREPLASLAEELRGRGAKEGLAQAAAAGTLRPATGEWHRCVLPEEEGASVEVQGLVTGMAGITPGAGGQSLRLSVVAAQGSFAVSFRALRIQGGPKVGGGLDGRATEMKRAFERPGTKVELRPVRAGTMPAYELSIDDGTRATALKLFEVADELFMATAEYDSRLEALVRVDVHRFLDSFVYAAVPDKAGAVAPPAP